MAAKPDYWVQKVQEWYNSEYQGKTGYTKITEDGIIGQGTCKALVHALQVELGVPTPNGTFGPTTIKYFNDRFGDSGIDETVTNENIIYILQGGFLCKGINCFTFDGIYGDYVISAIAQFRSYTGISGWGMDARHMKALLNTDPFVLSNSGHGYVREMQQYLNRNYSDYYWQNIGLIPCNGVPERNMSKAIIYALQYEEAKVINPSEPNLAGVDGIVGTNTLNNAPVLSQASDKKAFVRILQMALACMYLRDVGLDGVFDISVKAAVEDFQKFMCLNQNSSVTLGTVERKTWASLLLSKGDVSRHAGACDCSTILDLGKAQGIKAKGYNYVGRYLTGTVRKNGVSVSKALTSEEISAITTAGLRIFAIYQDGGASSTYFNYSKGYSDAQKAYEAAKNLRIPLDEIIYFAVDYDFTDAQTTTIVIPHFQGINAYFNEHGIKYKIGIYASRNICTRVSEKKLACSSFVADMSTGYSGNMGFRMPENWAFDQIQELKNFVNTPYFTEAFDLDRDVASGRYTGFDGTMLCGHENYQDVTKHDMVFLRETCKCRICGYEVASPEAQDSEILSNEEYLTVIGGTCLFIFYAAFNKLDIIYSHYDVTRMLLRAIQQIREKHPSSYEYSNGEGICQITPYAYPESSNEAYVEYPLVGERVNMINIGMYNGFIPEVISGIAEKILFPEYGILMSVHDIGDAMVELINKVNSDNISTLAIEVFSLLCDRLSGLKDLGRVVELIEAGILVNGLSDCKIEVGDFVVSYPICWNGTTTSDSMVVFDQENKIKMIVLNDLVNHEETIQ